jgi:hypothetical protein
MMVALAATHGGAVPGFLSTKDLRPLPQGHIIDIARCQLATSTVGRSCTLPCTIGQC